MKIVRFLGGLGNQMFQYAFYIALAEKFGKVKADLSKFEGYELHNGFELEKVFDITLKKASNFEIKLHEDYQRAWIYRKLRRILNKRNVYVEERNLFAYDASIFTDQKDRLLWGYWQNINYINAVEPILRQHFIFKQKLDANNQHTLDQINNGESVSIHVRRGDYINDPLLGGIATQAYYLAAIDLISRQIEKPSFFVFSNDIDWCKQNLNLNDATYVSGNNGRDSYIDMRLMSNCRHHIIANSSFSWWAAWLNPRKDKIVIAPKRWANGVDTELEICPSNWIRI